MPECLLSDPASSWWGPTFALLPWPCWCRRSGCHRWTRSRERWQNVSCAHSGSDERCRWWEAMWCSQALDIGLAWKSRFPHDHAGPEIECNYPQYYIGGFLFFFKYLCISILDLNFELNTSTCLPWKLPIPCTPSQQRNIEPESESAKIGGVYWCC